MSTGAESKSWDGPWSDRGATSFLIPLAFCLALGVTRASAESHPGMYEPELLRAENLMLSMQLDSADDLVDRWVAANPGRPAGLFFRAALLSWRLFLLPSDQDPGPLQAKFEKAVHDCRISAQKTESRRETEFDGTVYLGAVYGQEALLAMLDKRYLVMAPLARRAWDYIQRAVDLDPEYYDSYFGLGIYLYFTDALPKLVKVLAEVYGFEGDRERGLASLSLAVRHGLYSADPARIMLVNIYSEIERPDSSMVAMARDLHERYPDNPLVHWRLGDILLRSKSYFAAEIVYREVLHRLEQDYPYYRNRMFSAFSMKYRLGVCAHRTGRTAEALRLFESVLAADKVDPEWAAVESGLEAGDLYIEAGRTDQARACLKRVLQRDDFEDSHAKAKSLLERLDH